MATKRPRFLVTLKSQDQLDRWHAAAEHAGSKSTSDWVLNLVESALAASGFSRSKVKDPNQLELFVDHEHAVVVASSEPAVGHVRVFWDQRSAKSHASGFCYWSGDDTWKSDQRDLSFSEFRDLPDACLDCMTNVQAASFSSSWQELDPIEQKSYRVRAVLFSSLDETKRYASYLADVELQHCLTKETRVGAIRILTAEQKKRDKEKVISPPVNDEVLRNEKLVVPDPDREKFFNRQLPRGWRKPYEIAKCNGCSEVIVYDNDKDWYLFYDGFEYVLSRSFDGCHCKSSKGTSACDDETEKNFVWRMLLAYEDLGR